MVHLADVCGMDCVALGLFQCSASVGLKLLRAGVLPGHRAEQICALAAAGAVPPAEPPAPEGMDAVELLPAQDAADEVLVRLLPWAAPTRLLCAAATRNLFATSMMLVERNADLHHVEARHGRRRGLVDLAARAASIDGDWRLVLWLLEAGARPESPQAVLLAPLRRGNVSLARQLLGAGASVDDTGLASLLCDVCASGSTSAAAFLIDELHASVDTPGARDGLNCTDRAVAWRCWETAAWLIEQRGGLPSDPCAALASVLDPAATDPQAAAVLSALRARGAIGQGELMAAAVRRGRRGLLAELLPPEVLHLPLSELPLQVPEESTPLAFGADTFLGIFEQAASSDGTCGEAVSCPVGLT